MTATLRGCVFVCYGAFSIFDVTHFLHSIDSLIIKTRKVPTDTLGIKKQQCSKYTQRNRGSGSLTARAYLISIHGMPISFHMRYFIEKIFLIVIKIPNRVGRLFFIVVAAGIKIFLLMGVVF